MNFRKISNGGRGSFPIQKIVLLIFLDIILRIYLADLGFPKHHYQHFSIDIGFIILIIFIILIMVVFIAMVTISRPD